MITMAFGSHIALASTIVNREATVTSISKFFIIIYTNFNLTQSFAKDLACNKARFKNHLNNKVKLKGEIS